MISKLFFITPDAGDEKKPDFFYPRFCRGLLQNKTLFSALIFALKPLLIAYALWVIGYALLESAGPLALWFALSSLKGFSTELSFPSKMLRLLPLTIVPLFSIIAYTQQKYHLSKLQCFTNTLLRKHLFQVALDRASKQNPGSMIQLMSEDALYASKIWGAFYLFVIPLCLIFATWILFKFVGVSAFIGMSLILFSIPIFQNLEKSYHHEQQETQKKSEKLLSMLCSIFNQIHMVKYFVLEKFFYEKVLKERQGQHPHLLKKNQIHAHLDFFENALSLLAPVTTVAFYIFLEKNIVWSNLFASISLMSVVRHHLYHLVSAIIDRSEGRIALKRINAFLNVEEKESPDLYLLHPLPKEGLICIIGAVGKGKTTLLHNLLKQESREAKIGLLSQDPWCLNASIKDNITLFSPFDPLHYQQVIQSCELEEDFSYFPKRDETSAGEAGFKLSGGQKQRIALARLLYQDPSQLYLDDPFSAQDVPIAEKIFYNLYTHHFPGKKVVMTTNSPIHLHHAKQILYVDQGKISAYSSFEAFKKEKPHFFDLKEKELFFQTKEFSPPLYEEEIDEKAHGVNGVQLHPKNSLFTLLFSYLRALSSEKEKTFFFLLILLSLSPALQIMMNFSLIHFQNNSFETHLTKFAEYLSVGILSVLFSYSACKTVFKRAINTSTTLMKRALERLFKAPFSFFSSQAVGNILNHVISDTARSTDDLPSTFFRCFSLFCHILFSAMAISLNMPWMLLIYMSLGFFYYKMFQNRFDKVIYMAYLMPKSKGAFLSFVNETMKGLKEIGYLRKKECFMEEFSKRLTEYLHISLQRAFHTSSIWIRIETLGILTTLTICTLLALSSKPLSVSLISAILTYAFIMTQEFSIMFSIGIEFQMEANAFVRLQNYQAPSAISPNESRMPFKPLEHNIHFEKVTFYYKENVEPTLKELSLTIHKGEKVGLIGRTGAGKSSLIHLLLGLYTPSSGGIFIDGVSLSQFDNESLRKAIGIVPQMPNAYFSSLKEFLDPENEYEEFLLREALEKVGIHHALTLPSAEMSLGEKQLVGFAKVLIKKPAILLLDEAAASLDPHNVKKINRLIHEHFNRDTVIAISHKEELLMGFHKIYFIDQGQVQLI